jgi:hypothetical protein
MTGQTLAQELDRARVELDPDPGESSVTSNYADIAATLLACLRYSGLSDDEVRMRLAQADPALITERIEAFAYGDAVEADEAVELLEGLQERSDLDLQQAMTVALVGASGTF